MAETTVGLTISSLQVWIKPNPNPNPSMDYESQKKIEEQNLLDYKTDLGSGAVGVHRPEGPCVNVAHKLRQIVAGRQEGRVDNQVFPFISTSVLKKKLN